MSHENIESRIEKLLKPIITNLEYELYDVVYVKEGKEFYLRIIIDKIDGISIEDCEKVNNAIDEVLDEADLIKEGYFLEVSSPGIERNLRKSWHFEKQIGNEINIKLFKSVEGQKDITGILKSYNGDNLELEVENKILNIETKNIAIAKVVADLF